VAVLPQRLVNLQVQQEHRRVLEHIARQVELAVDRAHTQAKGLTDLVANPEIVVETVEPERMEQQIPQQHKVQATVSAFPTQEVDARRPFQRLHQVGMQASIRKRIRISMFKPTRPPRPESADLGAI
jgi:hypothetical protein